MLGTGKIVVIGGGPAGMSAAIFAAQKCRGSEVILIEKNHFLGRKLLATGNGRCNITNAKCENYKIVLNFFESMGIAFREEGDGRVYPYTEQAATIKEVLENEIKLLGIKTIYGKEVYKEGIKYINSSPEREAHFIVKGEDIDLKADHLIIATGGKAGPQYGSNGDGYSMARSLGHSLVKPIPSLVQVTSPEEYFGQLKGVRVKGRVTIEKDKVLDSQEGEIQFTENGLSGICVFDISRNIRFSEANEDINFKITLDIMTDFTEEEIKNVMLNKANKYNNNDKEFLFRGLVNKKLEEVLAEECNRKKLEPWEILKRWEIPVNGTKGFKEAQVTSGGIPLSEVNLATMESTLVRNLFFAGEILDYDGKCGGYNLQWAFETGIRAGDSVHV